MNRAFKEKIKKILPSPIFNVYHYLRWWVNIAKRYYYKYKYKGKKYHCVFCQHTYQRFMPDGLNFEVIKRHQIVSAGIRANCLCPNCLSKDRERLLYLFLQQKTNVFTGKQAVQLLHFAPEKCLKTAIQKQVHISYTNADLNPKAADVVMDITNISYPSNTFDVIICNHVLEHIPNDALAMQELHRVLKPTGWAVLQVPYAPNLVQTIEDANIRTPWEREQYFGQADHVRIYGQDYTDRLQRAGFAVNIWYPTDFLPTLTIEKQALIPNEPIFFVKSNKV